MPPQLPPPDCLNSNTMIGSVNPTTKGPQCLMPEHSFFLRPLWTCTAGAKTPSSLPSSNSTAKIASLNVKGLTSLGFNPTKRTPVAPMKVSTCTHLLSAPKNINLQGRATSPELTTPPSNLCSPTLQLKAPELPKSACTQQIITCSAS